MTLSITSNFDAGAIEVLSCEQADNIRLRVRRDSHAGSTFASPVRKASAA
jgi:hypothetical protein